MMFDLEIRALIRRMARENPSWGASHILSELQLLGYGVAQATVAISPSRRGRVVLGLGSAVILLGAYIVSPGSVGVGALVVGLIWLVQSVLFYAGILPALWDGGLCTLSAVSALGTAVSTHRLWLAVWVFFLLQGFRGCIPDVLR